MTCPRDDFLAALRHEETEVTPYGIGFLEEPAERMGRLVGPNWRDEIVRYTAGWALSFPRTPIEPGSVFCRDEFGCVWQKGSIWHIHGSPLKEPSLKGYRWPDLSRADRYAGLDRLGTDHPDKFRVAYTGLSFFELYWQLRGWEGLHDFAGDTAFAEELLDRFLDMQLQVVDRLAGAGVDCIGFCDDQSDQRGVTIGAPRWRRMLKPRFRAVFDRIHGHGKLTFLHCCGNVMEIVPDLIEIGLDYLNPLQPECMDVFALKRRYGRRLLLEGGIGTQQLLPFGSPEDIRREVRRCRLELGRGGGYILATTKAVRPETPDANMLALWEAMVRQAPRSSL
jgi:uroporphyrinogen decarboxylase